MSSRERKAETSYTQFYPTYHEQQQLPKDHQQLSFINGGRATLASPGGGIKHQPYLDTRVHHSHSMNDTTLVFADSPLNTILDDKHHPGFSQLVYGDSHQIILHGSPTESLEIVTSHSSHHDHLHIHDHEHSHISREHEARSVREGSSSASTSSGGSCESSSRRLRLETATQRQERLRKNAERGKLRRLEETEEQRQRRLARNAERGKLRRLEESLDKRSERLKKNAERQKARRNRESPEERQLRLWKNAERQRIRRSTLNGIKIEFPDYSSGISEHLL